MTRSSGFPQRLKDGPGQDVLDAAAHALLEYGPVPVTVVDREGRVIFGNVAAHELLWPTAASESTVYLHGLLHPDDASEFMQALLAALPFAQATTLPVCRVIDLCRITDLGRESQTGQEPPHWLWLEASALRLSASPAIASPATASPSTQAAPLILLVWRTVHVQQAGTMDDRPDTLSPNAPSPDRLSPDARQILQDTVRDKPLPQVLAQIALLVEQQAPAYFCAVFLAQHGQLHLAAAPSAPPEFRALFPSFPHPAHGAGWAASAAPGGPPVQNLARLLHMNPASPDLPPGLVGVTWMPLLGSETGTLGAVALYASGARAWVADSHMKVTDALNEARHLATLAAQQRFLLDRLHDQSERDTLTGLAGRTLFAARLKRRLLVSQQSGSPLALLFIDLDDFKAINDVLGHTVGDQVLRQVAHRLTACLGPQDSLARMGGDEFAVILPFANTARAEQTARQILSAFMAPLDGLDHEVFDLSIGISVGLPVADTGTEDASSATNPYGPLQSLLHRALMQSADLAMQQAKQHRSGYRVFGSELAHETGGSAHPPQLQLAAALRRAAESGELTLHYQPQVHLETGRLIGVEALLRWTHAELGPVSPAQFIPVAEASGLIVPIGAWVIQEACRQAAQWRRMGHTLHVAVNVSALQFAREDFVDTVATCLRDAGLPPGFLELELTERVVMTNVTESAAHMSRLRELGVSVSIDDFGTGYSSLSQLSRLPLSGLKIDRSFVNGLSPESSSYAIIQAVVGLARSLGLSTTAEGIETWNELALLQELECTLGQGFFLGRPMPAAQLEQKLAGLSVGGFHPPIRPV